MIQHTQEPWRFNEHYGVIHASELGLIEGSKTVSDMRGDNAKHNGRRIVACVNACAGMSNEQLDNISLISGNLLGRFTEQANILNLAEQQRDQAFKALAEIRALVGAQTEELIQDAIKRLIAERDNAWQELRDIREAIDADSDESTLDEVRRVVSQRERYKEDFEAQFNKVGV